MIIITNIRSNINLNTYQILFLYLHLKFSVRPLASIFPFKSSFLLLGIRSFPFVALTLSTFAF